MKKLVRTSLILAMPVVLSACSVLGVDFSKDKIQYETSASRAPLEVPPDLTQVPTSDRYAVPSRPQTVLASQQAEVTQNTTVVQNASTVLPEGEIAKVVREGNSRWIHVNLTPEQAWPIVQDFWNTIGLSLARQDAATGVMETNWAENRAKLPQDIIRASLGKVIDLVYSTGERDQYRARMERSANGGTDIFITHRSMVEVVKSIGGDNETTVWQPGPNDPELEAELMTRMAQRINMEFDPKAKAQPKEEREKAVEELTRYQPVETVSELEQNAEGVVTSLFVKEGFERAWRIFLCSAHTPVSAFCVRCWSWIDT